MDFITLEGKPYPELLRLTIQYVLVLTSDFH